MRDNNKNSNVNNISGSTFIGETNISVGNTDSKEKERDVTASCKVKSVWRSPITMASLSWISFFLTIIDVFSFWKIIEPLINIARTKNFNIKPNRPYYVLLFIFLTLLIFVIMILREITKKQTRHPLIFNYAINGLGKRITIEKVYPDSCPICNGKMKYHKIGKNTNEKKLVLECQRNKDHCWKVDPAEEKIKVEK